MNLIVKDIELENFRNYGRFDCGDFSSFNIFVGRNGVGKTNIIEAIQLLTSLSSFRNPKWEEVVNWNEEQAVAKARFVGDQRNLEVKMKVSNNKRTYFLNGKAKSGKELRGILPSVLFCPDDLKIVKGYSDSRRDSLDALGAQISNTYHDLKADYVKSIKQKTALLQTQDLDPSFLDPWNENISLIGAMFAKHRLNLFQTFRKNLVGIWLEMGSDLVIDAVYIPSWDDEETELSTSDFSSEQIKTKLIDKMNRLKEAEIASGRILVGPHKDDVKIYIDGVDARKFASQGQQRLIALSWKIAEMRTIEQICGQLPILLLDDVLSELDKSRKDILASYLLGNMQTFITATDVDSLDDEIVEKAQIFKIGE